MDMSNFCAICGTPLDKKTGKCIKCEQEVKEKKKIKFLRRCILIAIAIILIGEGILWIAYSRVVYIPYLTEKIYYHK